MNMRDKKTKEEVRAYAKMLVSIAEKTKAKEAFEKASADAIKSGVGIVKVGLR